MLDMAQIGTVAEQALRENLDDGLIEDVYAGPGVDWTGGDCLDVTAVVPKDAMHRVTTGRELGAAIRTLCDRLEDQGESRFPFITYLSRAGYRRRLRAKAKFQTAAGMCQDGHQGSSQRSLENRRRSNEQ